MIRKAHFIKDREVIIHLWQQCFGDSRDYVEFFLANCPEENALYLHSDGAGMMLLMPGEIVWNDRHEKVYYLYALCVDEKYRNKGIAGELLDYAKAFAKDNNAEICLVPSTERLRRYYSKRGFIDVFVSTSQEIAVSPAGVNTYTVNGTDGRSLGQEIFDMSGMPEGEDNNDYLVETDICEEDIDSLIEERTKIYGKEGLLWSDDNFNFALKEHLHTGGFARLVSWSEYADTNDLQYKNDADNCGIGSDAVYSCGVRYIIGDIEEDILIIRETNLQLPVIYRFARQYNCSKIKFLNILNPVEGNVFKTAPYAMMTNRLYTEKFIKDTVFYDRYVNFCFD